LNSVAFYHFKVLSLFLLSIYHQDQNQTNFESSFFSFIFLSFSLCTFNIDLVLLQHHFSSLEPEEKIHIFQLFEYISRTDDYLIRNLVSDSLIRILSLIRKEAIILLKFYSEILHIH
jgi:dolichol kinase